MPVGTPKGVSQRKERILQTFLHLAPGITVFQKLFQRIRKCSLNSDKDLLFLGGK